MNKFLLFIGMIAISGCTTTDKKIYEKCMREDGNPGICRVFAEKPLTFKRGK